MAGATWLNALITRRYATRGTVITDPYRILVAGPAWVGDMVMAQSLFITLKQRYPQAQLDVIAPGWSVPLLKRMPQVNDAIELPVAHKQLKLLQRYKTGKRLRDRHYQLAIVTPRSFKSALVPFFAGAKQRRGYRGEMRYGLLNDIRPLDKSVLKQTVQRYVALGLEQAELSQPAIPYPQLRINQDNQTQLLQTLQLNLDTPIVGFMPGAEYGPAKQWPSSHYRQLAKILTERGKQVWVFGSAREAQLGQSICAELPGCVNLCGKTQLVDVIDLIALCDEVITNDSGLMHVACATGRKVIAIYGSSDPQYTPPLSDKAHIVYRGLECSPCFARTCQFGHTNCLHQISAEEVAELVC